MSIASFASAFTQSNRLLSLSLSAGAGIPENVLLPYELSGEEAVSVGYTYELDCLSSDAQIQLKKLIGVPAQIALLTDSGERRAICGLITSASQLGADGGFAKYRLTLQDPFAVLTRRTNSRVFQDMDVRAFVKLILEEHRQRNAVLQECFDIDDRCRRPHPKQSWATQLNESDTAFIQRWLAQEGIGWFVQHGEAGQAGERPKMTLVLFDDAAGAFKSSSAAKARFHRADGTEDEDSITDWLAERTLVSSHLSRASMDYKTVDVDRQDDDIKVNQGDYGGRLAATLEDYHYDTSHAANDLGDYSRYGGLRADAHSYASKAFNGAGSHREFTIGETFELTGHPTHDQDGAEERQFALTRLECFARNNLPVDLVETAQRLGEDRAPPGTLKAALETGEDNEHGVYRNRFGCVRKNIPIVPAFNRTEYAKPAAPQLIIGLVVGPVGEEIHTDDLGRIKVRMPYARDVDHEHAQGAGASGTDADSQWIRVAQTWAGTEYGSLFLPRIGDEVLISYIGGDIDRPIVIGTVYNGTHRPATVSHAGKLPGNRMLSTIKSKMVKGSGASEVVWDDTTQEQRIRVGTDHGHTALNQGYLVHPRVNGQGAPRGEGFELRTDDYGAVRAAKGLLLSTDPRTQADSTHLDSKELTIQLAGSLDMSKALSEVAGGHLADPLEANTETERLLQAARKTYTQSGGTGKTGEVPGYEDPLLALSSPAGIIAATPKTAQIATGEHLHLSSQQDTNVAVGKRFIMAVKQAWSVFVAELDIKLFAGKGKVLIQAQNNNIEATARKDIKIASVAGDIEISTPNSLTLTAGGCQIRMANGSIDIKAPGAFTVYSSVKSFTGPASATYSGTLPQMPMQTGDMVIRHLYENGTGIPAQYKATLVGGEVRKGVLDASGKAILTGIPAGGALVEYSVEPRPFEHKPDWEPKLPQIDLSGVNAPELKSNIVKKDAATESKPEAAANSTLTPPPAPLNGFSAVQNQQIKDALAEQKKMLEDKKNELTRWNAEDQGKFKQAFGSTDDAAKTAISERLDKMLTLNGSMTADNFKASENSTPGVFAYVYPNDTSHKVYLDKEFWNANTSGVDSKAGVLTHEMSHFKDVGGTKDGFPKPPIYGVSDSRSLASTDSGKALMHADSFEYWVENAP